METHLVVIESVSYSRMYMFHDRNLDARPPSIPRDLAPLLLRLARVRLNVGSGSVPNFRSPQVDISRLQNLVMLRKH